MMDERGPGADPQRTLLTTNRGYYDALDQLMEISQRELRVFDPDLAALNFNTAHRIDALRRLLMRNRENRVYIALHDVDYVAKRCPRLISLLQTFPACLLINRTEGDALRAQDCFVLCDTEHFVRRPVAARPRGVLVLNDPREAHGMRERFEEIWQCSQPGVSASTAGL